MSTLDGLHVRTDFPPVASAATPPTPLCGVHGPRHRRNAAKLTQEDADAIRQWVTEHSELTLNACVLHLRDVYQMHPSALYALLRNDTWRDSSYVPRDVAPAPVVRVERLERPAAPLPFVASSTLKLRPGETPDRAQQRVIREYLAVTADHDRKVAV